jgi:glyoxylase-like metal-dependent hydrolase (beta-lactamase superfamily II)/8-oxo-dGTP pyrophosphatase MutT (NUDIX family)
MGGGVVPRDAATIMLVRDMPGAEVGRALQVCMLRRHLNSDFVGGAYVFPGGKVDDEDRSEGAASVCDGRDDAEASALLGVGSGGLAFFVAALRECFEEAGVLIARPRAQSGSVAPTGVLEAMADRLAARRVELNGGSTTFVELCSSLGLVLALDEVHYFSHWITPEGAPKRYDTRFFVAALPPGQVPEHDDYETVDTVWVNPAEALERHRAGEFDLIFPTIKNLQAISRFSTSSELLEAAMAIEHVPTVLPRVVADDRGFRILLPGDEGYDDLLGSAGGEGSSRGLPAAFDPDAPAVGGEAVELSRGVVRLVAPNPGLMTGPGTNSYLIGEEEVAVLDPGPSDLEHLRRLAGLGAGRIRWVLVTHTHPDHAPGAAMLKELTGAEVIGFDARDGFEPDRLAYDGFTLDVGGRTLKALHTPGHASNHLCWLLEDERMVFSGDHVMQGSTVVIMPPDGDMADYMASLDRLRDLDPAVATIAPGHGALIRDPAAVLDYYVAHRQDRERLVTEALATAGSACVDDLLGSVYGDVPPAMHPVARWSLWAHLRKLSGEGLVGGDDPEDIGACWHSA